MQLESGVFPIPWSSLPKEAKLKKIEASCELFMRRTVPCEEGETNLQDQKYENERIVVTTGGEWVLEMEGDENGVKSGFKCDYEIKFEIIRSTKIQGNKLGKPKGIKFEFPSEPEPHVVSLFLDEECSPDQIKRFETFTTALERKYIVQKQFHQRYKAIKRIGKGVTACVYSSYCYKNENQVAIKSFKREVYFTQDNGNGKKGFLKEFKILTELNSPYLSKLLGVYESDRSTYIVQELLDRTLHNYLQKFGFPDTTKTRRLLYQLLIGLRYLHKKNIMHRDIKLQNILVKGPGKDNIIPVIVDFGLADYEHSKEFVYIRCGTPGYVAPEVINLNKDEKIHIKYNKSCDIFSMGVIFHILQLHLQFRILGRTVFEGEEMREVVEKNKACMIDYEFSKYPKISPEIRDLLTGMLHVVPEKRYTVEQLMDHPFFVEERHQFAQEVYQMDKELDELQKNMEGMSL